jgi:hypothetical protein
MSDEMLRQYRECLERAVASHPENLVRTFKYLVKAHNRASYMEDEQRRKWALSLIEWLESIRHRDPGMSKMKAIKSVQQLKQLAQRDEFDIWIDLKMDHTRLQNRGEGPDIEWADDVNTAPWALLNECMGPDIKADV